MRRTVDDPYGSLRQLARIFYGPHTVLRDSQSWSGLTEGFGLPVAESISSGTPVVLSNFGSMKEVGEAGGAEFVNPRDLDDVTNAMRRLLVDDEHLQQLKKEAQNRDYSTGTITAPRRGSG